jgi:hypothetical protein
MVSERERACDDLVLSVGFEPTDYAQHLLQIASGLRGGLLTSGAAIAMARPSKLEGRLLAVLDAKRNRRALTRTLVLGGFILAASIAGPLAALRAKGEEKIRNPVRLDANDKPIVTHVLYIWNQPDAPEFTLEGQSYKGMEDVVARIEELMATDPFPYIRTRLNPPPETAQPLVEELGKQCRSIGFINMEFKYGLTAPPPTILQFRLLDAAPVKTGQALKDASTGQPVYVMPDVLLSGLDVESAVTEQSDEGHWNVRFSLTPDGTRRFAQITKENLGRRLAIIFDGKVVAAPSIQSTIAGGTGIIALGGKNAREEAQRIADSIGRSIGAAPAQPAFGPVIERVLAPRGKRESICLDLDTGELYDMPPSDELKLKGGPADLKPVGGWAATKGIDLFAKEQFLLGFDLAVFPQLDDRGEWYEASANMLGILAQADGQTPAVLAPPRTSMERHKAQPLDGSPATRPSPRGDNNLPATFFFKTRDGGMGALQITGYLTDKKPGEPTGIKIRYKMIERTGAETVRGERVRVPEGEMVTLVLKWEDLKENMAYDIETGQKVEAWQSDACLLWRRTAGEGKPGMLTHGLQLQGIGGPDGKPTRDLWLATTLGELPEFRHEPQDEFWSSPQTLAFRTPKGTVGVLELRRIEGHDVHVRYKILHRPAEAEGKTFARVTLPGFKNSNTDPTEFRLLDFSSLEAIRVPLQPGLPEHKQMDKLLEETIRIRALFFGGASGGFRDSAGGREYSKGDLMTGGGNYMAPVNVGTFDEASSYSKASIAGHVLAYEESQYKPFLPMPFLRAYRDVQPGQFWVMLTKDGNVAVMHVVSIQVKPEHIKLAIQKLGKVDLTKPIKKQLLPLPEDRR